MEEKSMLFPEITDEDIKGMMQDDFKKGALCIGPSSWERHAQLLKRAADIIFEKYKVPYDKLCSRSYPYYEMNGKVTQEDEDIHLKEIYYLLLGLSIENLAKAIIMINNPNYLTNEGLIKVDKHETDELFRENGITEFIGYEELLRGLASYVKWKGKYPVPLKQEEFDWSLDWFDPKKIDELYKKLHRRLIRELRLRDLKEKHHINKSIEEFLNIKKEISNFMKPETKIRDIIDAYQYPFPLIKEILRDHNGLNP